MARVAATDRVVRESMFRAWAPAVRCQPAACDPRFGSADAVVTDRDEQTTSDGDEPSQEGPVVSDGTDTDMLLIDFR